MIKLKKIFAAAAAAMILIMPMSACSDSDNEKTDISDISAVPSAESLKENITGQWGRLGETMHYFNKDMTCIIGGMQGTYDINSSASLVLTTANGDTVVYIWSETGITGTDSGSTWSLVNGILKVNGNTFEKISDEDYDEAAATADETQ